ncbi:hypothetical protein A2165_00985 [Candidatus Curtissbacteria bacterium RBG_13_40_7]|uniref:ECF transporter S component n=1 Tax=Candidatus Curtissbacteria bacterium RBG_13_40_7 TaxID=1797706 RepID=A0A1F5FUR8_9BACT|nr:MAG: hypothetical protein A2165_00985 [Candidatus Curtissbacteria bacterium RBG_13_40_7]
MKKGLTTTKLIVIGGFAALNVLIELSTSLITVYSGIPLMSGALTAFIGPIIGIVFLLTLNTLGAYTIFQLLYSVLILPTHLWGPPGFFPKILICLIIGLLIDFSFYYLKKYNKFLTLVLIAFIADFVGTVIFIILGRALNIPGVEKTAYFISSPIFILAFVLVAAIDAFVGLKLFNKIKSTSVVMRIQK